jgi:hypothetical protein
MNTTETTFDPKQFIDSLIEEMGMQNEAPEKVEALKKNIEEQMNHIVLSTASLNLDPEIMDYVLEEYKDEEDIGFLLSRIIEYSAHTQLAILDALDDFREETLMVYSRIKKA